MTQQAIMVMVLRYICRGYCSHQTQQGNFVLLVSTSESHKMADIIVHEQSVVIVVDTLDELPVDTVSDEDKISTNLDTVEIEALDA